MSTIKAPFGAADSQALSATGAQAITITNQVTFLDGVTTIATGNRTINLTIDAQVALGARIYISHKATGTETLIAGTGMKMPTTTGAAGKTKVLELVYNGTAFIALAIGYQID